MPVAGEITIRQAHVISPEGPSADPQDVQENPSWGAPRIHGELLKLGFNVGESSVSKYIVRNRKPPSQTRRTFLENHAQQLVSIDVFTVPTIRFQVLYVFLVLAHDRRHILHFNVTAMCRSKISKCLSGWGLFRLHNSR